MAISPETAITLTEEESAVVADLESFIDSALRREYDGGVWSTGVGTIGGNITRIRDELIKRYKWAGWKQVLIRGEYGSHTITLSPLEESGSSYFDR